VFLDETATEVTDISVPVAEWMSRIVTPSNSRKACLLFDFYPNKNVFKQVRFEMIYRSADNAATVQKKLLFSVTNDGFAERVTDVLEYSLDYGISRYQVSFLSLTRSGCRSQPTFEKLDLSAIRI